MVTKQQQLEWLAKEFAIWPGFSGIAVHMSNIAIGVSGDGHAITREEWQRERDKMSSKPEVDNSWHERGELPPIGCECEYNDAEWGFEDVSVTPMDGDKLAVCAKSKTPSGRDCVIFTWVSKNRALLAAASASPAVFRPLRTEREKAIDEMMSLVMDGLMSHEMAIEFVIKLHDAGYRKANP